MRLAAPYGNSVILNITAYQYPEITASGPADWDANWLVVAGQVRTGDADWTFHDPCLTTWEAHDLSSWLRGIATGTRKPQPADANNEQGLLTFTEPCLAFSYQQRHPETAIIRVFFSLEAAPPSTVKPRLYEYYVDLPVPHESVASAADEWDTDLSRFPPRP